ncbi:MULTISPECIES: DUF2301 domain-containing membrane protein [unclassified Tolypothrix]|uniref:DUF2301 domain-containing membrane protein n=1 Tax=unclassified Tolypothrix TaxID=2649714 RepID=UPI0005EAC004|nr:MULTISPECIES: DUF2301 domain-containing membrane protein [unclassified Tolypothrix]BAY92411.1 hypothetical protein NIES3275_44460 [Microchaete diplosiphon NIES-3275]EKF05935.1 hypothetical protein FDUTEX481_00286 [Tolypothrix sp. PCC 7601]MBE9084257.1 DUF2301 domain-containing membrane protein [Tolypothrix sp. LEGE 11397]UYD26372.1 DUF2301 domain-containing membrane protein [Tolypothrix sp. PCC 7712]UYD31391.1 DUF2301 domain-containing membrane protein [Tolypothrix sp. PCC 7601]
MTTQTLSAPEVYQGQFGEFTITQSDRTGVIIYRAGLMVAALSLAIASALVVFNNQPATLAALTPLYACFTLALGVSLFTIHIYMLALHRLLQAFWAIGSIAAVGLAFYSSEPLAVTVYNHPLTLFGVGFTFVALTGIYFKEAFCFNRLETKILTFTVPILLLGHLVGILPIPAEQVLLGIWAILFLVFALRKTVQAIPADIGDKSVFTYLKQQRSNKG